METIEYVTDKCAYGSVLIAFSKKGICCVLMGDKAEDLLRDVQKRMPFCTVVKSKNDDHKISARRLCAFIDAPHTAFDPMLDIRGTAFQQKVWNALRGIPAGKTTSYSGLARQLNMPKSARAVAGACAANPIAILIPCHRVVRNDGSLSGYRWGIERKKAILRDEALRNCL